jgi:hypothetical protein
MVERQSRQFSAASRWSDVLGVMEVATAKSIECAKEREQELASLDSPDSSALSASGASWQKHVERSARTQDNFISGYQAAQQSAADLENAIAATEEALAGWLLKADSIRQGLVNWVSASL